MELKERKKINNKRLRKCNIGQDQVQGVSVVPEITMPTNVNLGEIWVPKAQISPVYGVSIKSTIPSLPTVSNLSTTPSSVSVGKIQGLPSAPATNNSFAKSNIVGQGITFLGSIANTFGNNKSAESILTDGGTQQSNAMGVGYQRYLGPNEDKEWKDLKRENFQNTLGAVGSGAALGASVGSIVPGIGTLVGGVGGALVGGIASIFGSSSRKRKLERALNRARLTAQSRNMYAYSGAASKALENDYYNDHANTDNSVLYANRGKDLPMYNNGKDRVWTPSGLSRNLPNALVGLGESIVDFDNKTATLVKNGKRVGVDDQYANVSEDTHIGGNDYDIQNYVNTGNLQTFAEQEQPLTIAVEKLNKTKAQLTKNPKLSSLTKNTLKFIDNSLDKKMSDIKTIADRQSMQHNNRQNAMRAYGNGKDDNQLVDPLVAGMAHIPSLIGGLQQLSDSKKQISVPNFYRSNPYEGLAINNLRKNYYNPYNQLNSINNALRYSLYGLNGLTGAQRAKAAIAATLGAGMNSAKIYDQAQDINNKYNSERANMYANLGQQERAARINAAENAYKYLQQGAATAYKMRNIGWANVNNSLEQTYADMFKLNMAKRNLDLFNAQLTQDQRNYLKSLNG